MIVCKDDSSYITSSKQQNQKDDITYNLSARTNNVAFIFAGLVL